MTKDGKENRFGRFIFSDEQAERVAAGDMSAVWEFVQDNRKYLTAWARSYARKRYFIETDDLLNQIYVDFVYYPLTDEKAIGKAIFRSFIKIMCGGYKGRGSSVTARVSLNAPVGVSSRNGDKENCETLGELLPNGEASVMEVLEREEHIKEIAPVIYYKLRKTIERTTGTPEKKEAEIRELIERVFAGFTYEEVLAYAS